MTQMIELELPEDAPLPMRLRMAWNAIRTLQHDPKNPVAGGLLNLCLDRGVYGRLSEELATNAEGQRMLDERPALDAAVLDVTALEALPDGTLGRELARYFERNAISPFESPFRIRNDAEYLSKRYRETHDLAHVLTGYDTDVVGEMELQAFMLGNLRIPTAALIITFGSIYVVPTLKDVAAGAYLRRLRAAHRRGAASRRLIELRYERFWDQTVDAVRAMLRIPSLAAASRPAKRASASAMTALLALLTLGAAALTWPPPGTAQDASVPGVLAGSWAYDGTAARGMAIVEAAFRPGLATLPELFQGFALSRIRDHMSPPLRVVVALTGSNVHVSFASSERTTVIDGPLGGVATTVGVADGTRVASRLRSGWLELRYDGEGGMSQILSTEPDGAHMHVDYTVESERLPAPVRYRLDYVRSSS
jgi:ubiquinone biosynthesis protein COQ4